MKKFMTILLAMSMMSCAFASCGKKESDKEDKKSSVAEEEVHPAAGRWEAVEDKELRDAEYSVDGDTMIIINNSGEEAELERITKAE